MKLRQIASNDPITSQLVSKVEENSTLLRNYIEFFQGNGLSSTERKTQGMLEVAGRKINSPYKDTVLDPEVFTVGRVIFGSDATVDMAYERMHVGSVASEMLAQVLRYANGIANKFHDLLINGDETSPKGIEFNGLKKLTDLTKQVVTAAADGLLLQTGTADAARESQQLFLEKLEETIYKARGANKVILCNARTIARINSIARLNIQYTTDTFGKMISTYNGIPLINVEETGLDIIPFNETVGKAKDCASLYVACLAERDNLSFFTTAEKGFVVSDMRQVDNFYKTTIEFTAASALFNDQSIARLQGFRIANTPTGATAQ